MGKKVAAAEANAEAREKKEATESDEETPTRTARVPLGAAGLDTVRIVT